MRARLLEGVEENRLALNGMAPNWTQERIRQYLSGAQVMNPVQPVTPQIPVQPTVPQANPAPGTQATTPGVNYNPAAGAYQPTRAPGQFTPPSGVTPSDAELQRFFGFLPASPHQIPTAKWIRLLPSERDLVLAAFEAKGWHLPDAGELINRAAPGGVAMNNQYAGVYR